MQRFVYALWGLSLLVTSSGCVATGVGTGGGAGVGTYNYATGELRVLYSVPIDKLWPRILAAMQDLQLTVDSKFMDALGGEIEARRNDGTPVRVQLKPTGSNSTTVDVRVGSPIGSKEKAERVHSTIQQQLRS
jgi:hypothetical protein